MKTLIDLLKTVKRALTRTVIRLCNGLFRLLPVQNRVLFYTIRADGRLLENSDCAALLLMLPGSLASKPAAAAKRTQTETEGPPWA